MKDRNQVLSKIVVKAITDNVLPDLCYKSVRDINTVLLRKCIEVLSMELSSSIVNSSPKFCLCWNILNYYCPEIDEKECIKNLKWVDDIVIGQGIQELQLCSIYKYLNQETPGSPEIER